MTQRSVSQFQINLLGPVEVRLAEADLTPALIHKVKGVLAYLAVEAERPHPRESLAGLLWPDRPETVARQNLRQTLLRLRRAVGAEYLEASRKTVQFNLAGDVHLDVAAFTTLIAACHKHDHAAPEVCTECASRLEEAAALYRGDFLAQFFLEDSAPFEEWASLKREWLRTEALQALNQLATYHEGQDDYEAARRFTWRQVELDPLREEARRQVMRLLALQGRRSEALAQFETCRQVLAEELGVEPSAETTALVERIRAGELSRGVGALGRKGAGERGSKEDHLTPASRHNLPAQTTPFVGREGELADLARLFADPTVRLLTIFAPGGMGKTRLALEIAAAQVDRYPNGVYLVSLAPLSEPETMVSAIAEAVGYPFQADKRSPRQQLLDYFRAKELLLLLDNFEHLLEGVDLVTAILQAAPGVRMLVTSRERLRLSGETVFSLEGLDFPEPGTRPGADYSALKLFIQSAQRVQPAFAPLGDEVEAIARICRLVAGMPLGILLAASWTEMLTPGEIAAEIGQSFDFLAADLRDLPERQRSLRAVFAQTWRRLSEAERDIFMRLSVFRGGFTHEATQAVTGASLSDLLVLMGKSLLNRTATGRYEVHELVRQYAAEKLDQRPAMLAAARDRHSAYYADFLHRLEADLKGKNTRTALAAIETELDNVRAAWQWAVAQGQIDRLGEALESLAHFYHRHGYIQEGEVAYRTAVERLTATGTGQRILVRLLFWQSHFCYQVGQTKLARQLLQQGLALLDSPLLAGQDTRLERAAVLRELGKHTLGYDREEAQRLLEEAVALCRAVGDPWGVAAGLGALGWMTRQMGDYERAQQLQEECLAICQTTGYHWQMPDALDSLAFGALAQTHLEEAERLARRALAIRQDIGYRAGIARGRRNLGVTLTLLGKFAAGYEQLAESEAIYLDFGMQSGLLFLKTWLGFAELHLGAYQKARQHSQEGLALGREAGHQGVMGNALFVLGCLAWVEGCYIQAQQWLQESATIYQTIKQWHERGVALAALGHVEGKLGNRSGARQALAQALQTGETRALHPLLLALSAIALLLIDQGETERGVELYALASRYLYVSNSRWFEDVAGRQIAAVAERLPPKVVAAARERGKTRDLWATAGELLAELEE